MGKVVIRWPIQLKANGEMKRDQSFRTGMRMITVINKRTRLGLPSQGLSAALLEQAEMNLSEDRMMIMVTIINDIARFLPAAIILGMELKKSLDSPRKMVATIKYAVKENASSIYSFQWSFNL